MKKSTLPKRRRDVLVVELPRRKVVRASPVFRSLALLLTQFDAEYAATRETLLKQIAFYYGYELHRRQ